MTGWPPCEVCGKPACTWVSRHYLCARCCDGALQSRRYQLSLDPPAREPSDPRIPAWQRESDDLVTAWIREQRKTGSAA